MSEQGEGTYIPGDYITVDLGHFTHRQHLDRISVVYARTSNPREQIVLTGEPQSIAWGSASGDDHRSSVIVQGRIPATASAGTYILGSIAAHTYGDNKREFADITDERVAQQRTIPQSIRVESEPPDRPTFV